MSGSRQPTPILADVSFRSYDSGIVNFISISPCGCASANDLSESLLKSNAEAIEQIQSFINQNVTILDQGHQDISSQLNEIAEFLGDVPNMMMDLLDIKHKLRFVGDVISTTAISKLSKPF